MAPPPLSADHAQIHTHLLPTPSNPSLLPLLSHFLPHSLPVYRRIQFPHNGPHTHILSTFPPSTNTKNLPTCFAVAVVDRSRRPETEAWIFLSGELERRCGFLSPHTSSEDDDDDDERASGSNTAANVDTWHCSQCSTHLLALLHAIKVLPVPPNLSTPALLPDSTAKPDTNQTTRLRLASHVSNPSLLLLGSAHARLVDLLRVSAPKTLWSTPDFRGHEIGYTKFLIPCPSSSSSASSSSPDTDPSPCDSNLPPEISYTPISTSTPTPTTSSNIYPLIRSRTPIPRTEETLRLLPSAIVSHTQHGPVAWAFLGLDGSLSTLFVEPGFRGRGLGKWVAGRVLGGLGAFTAVDEETGTDEERRNMKGETGTKEEERDWKEEGRRWCHADVLVGNEEGEGVVRALGGREGWVVYWVRVDLGEV